MTQDLAETLKTRAPLTAALIVAAGRGERAGGGLPKQYRQIGGKSVLRRTLEAFCSHPDIGPVCVVISPDDRHSYEADAAGLPKLLPPARGGATRQQSVLNGLHGLAAAQPDIVLIHDAARPFVSAELIGAVVERTGAMGAAVPGLSITDSLKAVAGGAIVAQVSREGLVAVQTPQGFRFDAILAAHRRAADAAETALTDDAAVAALAGIDVAVIPGDPANVKLTTSRDIEKADEALRRRMETRTGQGFDVHAFAPGDGVWLCGVRVPHGRSLLGHSDADVGLHALTDAILGAIGDGDIGRHFPPSDPQWKGASSDQFLADAVRRLKERGGRIVNVDVTLICEAPKIAPHSADMVQVVARLCHVPSPRVSIKATTTERLGFPGREEGIACLAVATVELPAGDE